MSESGTTAYLAFKAEMTRRCEELRRLPKAEYLRRCLEIAGVDQSGEDGDVTVGEALERAAREGSIEACAALFLMLDERDPRTLAAICAAAERSPDVMEGLQIEALAGMFEEWADEEVRAGRATSIVGPDGRKLYAFGKKRGRR